MQQVAPASVMTGRWLLLSALTMEIGLAGALFWMYARDWGDLTILYGFFMLPLVALIIGASQVKEPPGKLLIGCALGGLLGLVGALGIGPHLSGSVAIQVVLVQSIIMGIVYWKRAERGN